MSAHQKLTPTVTTVELRPGAWVYHLHGIGGLGTTPLGSQKEAALAGRQRANCIGFQARCEAAIAAGRDKSTQSRPLPVAERAAALGLRPVLRPQRRWSGRHG